MTIERHPVFKKNFKKRIAQNLKLLAKTKNRIEMFTRNPRHPLLRDHTLTGSMLGSRAFWITGDIRIVYQEVTSDHVLFLDIGAHNQIYR